MRFLLTLLLALASPAAAQVLFVPPADEARIQFGQNGSLSSDGTRSITPPTLMIGQRATCWACAPVPGVGTGFYIPIYRDPLSTTGSATLANPHDRTWFEAHHPDWLVYADSGATTPSTGGSGNLWAVNINLQEVRDYMLAYAKNPVTVGGVASATGGVLKGYHYLSVDNAAAYNANSVGGYYAGATPGCGSAPSFCGSWVQLYTGADIDAAWAADIYSYVDFLKVNLNKIGVGVWLNAKMNKNDVRRSIDLSLRGNAVLRESPFQHACEDFGNTDFVEGLTPGTDWYAQMQQANAIYNKQVITQFYYLCGKKAVNATNPEIAYAVANYYLTRGKYTYFEMQNGTSNPANNRDDNTLVTYPAPFLVYLGAPMEAPPTAGTPNSTGGCYQRRFRYGMVVVWPSSTGSCTYTVPAGYSWKDQFGASVASGVNTLSPDASVSPSRANAIVIYRDP